MSEKRFRVRFEQEDGRGEIVNETGVELTAREVVDCLNKQQDRIEQLQKIAMMYQGHNPCDNCTYCLEDKVCCGIYPPILCDEMRKNYFVYGLCKKHKQIQKSIRRYDDE